MRKQTWLLILIIVAGLAMLGWVVTHLEQPMSGATYIGLALGCRLEVYDTRVVPETTVRLACPGQAIINVWPSPKGKLWCPECIDNFWKQLDWGEVLPEINLP
ncbi:MAG: hypothetical protein A2W35_22140 [Chloroflexi bacterium RBG_16_57_11]|nr:MAG: hypothetical protein A2W35_22140 [Chloroflexi bacterium RBG_16_57_11]